MTPVLIVGAGPAGLIAAIRLREAGIQVRLIDEQAADGSHGFPSVIHQRTLRILNSMGITAPLEWRGHDVTRLAVYSDGRRRAVLELPSTGEIGSAAMTLPQDVLREALLNRLSSLGTPVEWQTRLVTLEQDSRRVRVGLVRRERSDDKRARFEPAWLDLASESLDAEFVIGADGPQSAVRENLGIDWVPSGRTGHWADKASTSECAKPTISRCALSSSWGGLELPACASRTVSVAASRGTDNSSPRCCPACQRVETISTTCCCN